MTSEKQNILLLGGHDLEMSEIKKLLIQHGQFFYDNELNWSNAKLASYAEQLRQYGNQPSVNIYGIELQEDQMTDIPANYFRIDHHNQVNPQPSSIEQVATLLNTELTHYQKCVSANDYGYIPAMKAAGANEDEIIEIRKSDRAAQGVTEKDEELAELSIKSMRNEANCMIIKSLTTKFSAICDRLYPYSSLLIYTDNELCYYGERKESIVTLFTSQIEKGQIFSGGGPYGYIGTARGAFDRKELVQIKESIIQIITL